MEEKVEILRKVSSMKKILIVEDDCMLNNTLSGMLTKRGFDVGSAYTAKEAFQKIRVNSYSLIILDVNLGDANGFVIFNQLKELSKSAIIFMTANDLENDILQGYDLGADDYVTKPFSFYVIQKKIIAIMNRLREKENEKIFDDGHFFINLSNYETMIDKKKISFTPLEIRVLEYFITNSNRILSRNQILENVWDIDEKFVDESSLNAIVSRIRSKIETKDFKYFKTIYGVGYIWIGNKCEG